ncbi:uncharacterized protein LOC119399289 [Rhipicephalus sanguineus]|uniref:uncharacterized protein LOC119399289 n=1 Tax=Rhipicephalus sanguineus TaxID=34632 RepID=UPI0020C1F235|nr:uncharacterized protein LOC119399289 [Rhipicephalus sanguineus]
MQRMLGGPSFSQCGMLRTCCKMVPSANRGGPVFQPESPIQPDIMAQLFPKKAAFGSPHRRPVPNLPLPFRKPVRRPPVPIDATLPFPAPSVGILGPMLTAPAVGGLHPDVWSPQCVRHPRPCQEPPLPGERCRLRRVPLACRHHEETGTTGEPVRLRWNTDR